MNFVYEAIAPDGATVTAQIEAAGRAEAAAALREKGLMVMRLAEPRGGAGAAAAGDGASTGTARTSIRDRIMFTRQMKMLLEAGAPLVPALEAAEQQITRPALRALMQRIRRRVEEGAKLTDALEAERDSFDPVFLSMVAAGEASATLPQAFGRLSALSQQQMQTRKLITGALTYPALLSILLVGVVIVLITFVVPRFKVLFASMKSPLPATTHVLFTLSDVLCHGWPFIAGGLGLLIVAGVVAWRAPASRDAIDRTILRLPLVGRVVARLLFARLMRVWSAMLRSHLPLLDTIRQSRSAVRNVVFLRLVASLEEAVSTGGQMVPALAESKLIDPVVVSAIRTGEQNGRLAEAVEFVSAWIEEDNAALLRHVTQLAEPLMLAFMGVVVGFVAMALFVPLFDLAMAA